MGKMEALIVATRTPAELCGVMDQLGTVTVSSKEAKWGVKLVLAGKC